MQCNMWPSPDVYFKVFFEIKRHLRPFSPVSSMKQIFSYLLHFFCQQLFLFSFGNQVVSIRGFIFPVLIGLKWRLGNSGHCLPEKLTDESLNSFFDCDSVHQFGLHYQNPFAFLRKNNEKSNKTDFAIWRELVQNIFFIISKTIPSPLSWVNSSSFR